MLSQLIRFALPPPLTIKSPEFLQLRQTAAAAGAVAQYFGSTIKIPIVGLPKKKDEICWAIQWPDASKRDTVASQLAEIGAEDPVSLVVEFPETQSEDFTKAFEAPVTEYAFIRLSDEVDLSDSALQASMRKTFTDTYHFDGLVGGCWAYTRNTNDSLGEPFIATSEKHVPEEERRLGMFYFGWESIEHHERATKTELFAEELTKLSHHCARGTGAFYVKYEKH